VGAPVATQQLWAVGLEWRGRKTPTPLSPPQAPTSPYLFIYLGKGPTAEAGNGPIPGGWAEEQGVTLCCG
jgi:hypothetical protein